ncbi:hypothetical protein RhiirA4_479791 [Rhizophagus irregularis]|uniref:Uncharacterized protein n=1 Tax=Rhizophagus irregularis TaxID=588596 RepID=A0A2I1HGY3_9GLOM|nr:hypothetical protein RhiirA4_479791 [Rhizophagus irregularis]
MDDSNDNQNTIINQNKKKRGHPKTDIWDYFKEGLRNRGHCSAEYNCCGWKQQVGQPIEMQGHIALNCLKVSPEVKSLFLEKVKNNGHLGYNKKIKISHNQPKIDEIFDSTKIDQAKIEMANCAIVKFFACCVKNNGHLGYNKKIKISHNQPKIDEIFDSTKIDQAKIEMANCAIVKFFACCGIPFHIIENPFFIGLLRTLCLGYNLPCRQTLTEDMLNAEILHVITEINLKLNNEKNLTLVPLVIMTS